jgi:glycosyltransferase involved in cell wall biosynthesis
VKDKPKIIHILSIEPPENFFNYSAEYFNSNISSIEYDVLKSYPYWVGYFRADHHVVAAKELQNETDEFDIECWRPYGKNIDRIYVKEVDGIIHKVFPSKSVNIPQVGYFSWSDEMLKHLRKTSEDNKILVNMSTGHLWFNINLASGISDFKNFPLVGLHRSGGFKIHYYRNLHVFKKILKFYYLIEYYMDLKSVKAFDFYFSSSLTEANYMKNVLGIQNAGYYMDGVDFDYFKPGGSKEELRKKLNLPPDKKILMAVGNFKSTDYGYDKLVDCYREVKKTRTDLQLVIIGGYRDQDVYQMGIDAGVLMIERIPREQLLDFYRASDFYTQAIFGELLVNSGGFGSALIEALACGLPVISNNIIHLPGTKAEREKIGMTMWTKQELVNNIIYMCDNYGKYTECRETARKYYDINNTRKVLVNKYRELIDIYYKG